MNIDPKRTCVKTYNPMSKLPLGSVRAEGWMREQLLRSKAGMGGHLDELEPEMIATPFISYSAFKRLPNQPGEADPTFAAGWSSEISGTYWTGLVQLAFTLHDDELIAKAERWIDGVLKHQEADGYLGGYPATTNRMADYNAWGSAWCYRAMLSFYEATGREDVLGAVHRGLLWFVENWRENKTDYVGSIIIEPMTVVYAYTGDERLIRFCYDWFDWLEENSRYQNKISQYLSDSLPFSSMHCVAYGEDVKHPAIVYCATGEERLLNASIHGMHKALERIVQPTGGPSSVSERISPKGSINPTEYCNYSTYDHSYSWLALATGEACWGDRMERCAYNAAQGARKKDERAIAYFSAPNQVAADEESTVFDGNRMGFNYAPCFYVACCPAQSVRTVPELIRSSVLRERDGRLALLCYGPYSVRTEEAEFVLDTLYPFRETVKLCMRRGKDVRISFRVPGWCRGARLTLNGSTVPLTPDADGFARPDVGFSAGDEAELCFPMEVRIARVDDSASQSKFPICVERGPLVYALPIPTVWNEIPGMPITPLPEGWSWYEAEHEAVKGDRPWDVAIDEALDPASVRVVEREGTGYVWEDPPIALELPLYPAKFVFQNCFHHMREPWETPVDVTGEAELHTLVPHGCTNLRITYLPRARVKK